MKSLIICFSFHHKNTEKIAKIFAQILEAEIKKPFEVKPEEIDKYDLIGFGSGIYFWRHHQSLFQLVKNLPKGEKNAFIFSTSGIKIPLIDFHKPLRKMLLQKGFKILAEFSCPGFDTFGPLKIFGGINKGRPNEKDFEKAKNFAIKIKENLK
jgi:flavodoxin